ncbi:MAG: response regulator [Flavobacteriales bacterium]|jgi:two-component system, response regulator PdtaR|nr:response regulator [Flavobacteriales bacterium]MBP9161098.1 response regulator [Flavobacteriales bacterium]
MKKILIIEDESIISFGYQLQLERMGFEVSGRASSSAEAEILLKETNPDAIMMDVYLKGEKNGLELAREIRRTDQMPIIFLTASSRPEIVDGISKLDHCHYLLKPIDPDGLNQVLYGIMDGHA